MNICYKSFLLKKGQSHFLTSHKHLISFDKQDVNIGDSKIENFTYICKLNCTPDFKILYKVLLGSLGCCNIYYIGALNNTHFLVTVLEAGSPRSGC